MTNNKQSANYSSSCLIFRSLYTQCITKHRNRKGACKNELIITLNLTDKGRKNYTVPPITRKYQCNRENNKIKAFHCVMLKHQRALKNDKHLKC